MITSVQNPRVKNVVKLRERRQRERQGRMIIEGYRELRRALDNAVDIDEVFCCEELFQGVNEPRLLADAEERGAEVVPVSPRVFRKLAYRDRPEGLLAVAPLPRRSLEDLDRLLADVDPFVVVVEGIEKPGNLGTILRSADAAGASALLVCERVTDVYNPNVVRASLGTLFTVPVVQLPSGEAHAWLEGHGWPSFAATPAATTLFTEAPLRRPCAVVLGSEQYGLRDLWMKNATEQIRIPMAGQADSLNVAQAATLVMFEVARQSAVGPPPGD